MARNRLQIVNWRQHGDDESYCRVKIFTHRERQDLTELIEKELGIERDPDGSVPDETYYVNDDFAFENGQVITRTDGRKFKISIREVK